MKRFFYCALALGFMLSAAPKTSQAQMISTEERFQDLFVTAGYGTAFGAAFGAALLSFQAKPQDNLRFVAIGASVGFIGGSLLGTYVIFSPALVSSSEPSDPWTPFNSDRSSLLRIVPSFETGRSARLARLESQWTLLRF